jgi:hypothetical protein
MTADDQETHASAEPSVLLIDVGALGDLDLVDISAILQLQLLARRFGVCVQLCNARASLKELLVFTGFETVLPCGTAVLHECVGHPEVGEEVRVDEEVDPVDPAV